VNGLTAFGLPGSAWKSARLQEHFSLMPPKAAELNGFLQGPVSFRWGLAAARRSRRCQPQPGLGDRTGSCLAWCYRSGPVWPRGLCAASAGRCDRRIGRWIHLLQHAAGCLRTGHGPAAAALGGSVLPLCFTVCGVAATGLGVQLIREQSLSGRMCAGSCTLQLTARSVAGPCGRAALAEQRPLRPPQRGLDGECS